MTTFDDLGLTFDYPDDWTADVVRETRESSVTLESPGSAFVMVTVIADRPDPGRVLDTAQAALEAEYDDCEVEQPAAEIAGVEADAREIDFTCHDLVSRASLRAFEAGGRTVFVMSQRADIEADEADAAFEAVTGSMRVRE